MGTISSMPALAAATVLLPTVAAAQEDRPAYVRALAAGYKAGFVCSNLFNGGLGEAQTEADDLRGTYENLNPLFATLKARVDRDRRTVSVAYDPAMPPRIAVWRPLLGCAQLPIGATPDAAAALPRIGAKAPDLDARAWPLGDREAMGRASGDARALGGTIAKAFDRRSYGQGSETTAVLVVQNGRIVAERYRPDFNMHMSQRTWSVAKSMAGSVIGAAVHQEILALDGPAPVPEWSRPGDPRSRITTDHLLRMASGLHSDTAGNRTDALYFGGTAVTEEATGWSLEAEPGARWRYANNDTLLAIRALRAAIGRDDQYLAFPFTQLFWKIGMTRTVAETDWQGNFILSSQVWTTARDLARLGLLYLQDGVWQGERILPAGWLDYARRHGPAQPASGYGYGASFWTFPRGSGLPEDAIVMRGNRGQYVVIAPTQRLVIVRRGYDGAESAFDLDAFTKDLLAALR